MEVRMQWQRVFQRLRGVWDLWRNYRGITQLHTQFVVTGYIRCNWNLDLPPVRHANVKSLLDRYHEPRVHIPTEGVQRYRLYHTLCKASWTGLKNVRTSFCSKWEKNKVCLKLRCFSCRVCYTRGSRLRISRNS